MKDLLNKVRSNLVNTLSLSYDINNLARILSSDINYYVNDGVLDKSDKYGFIVNIIKDTLNGKKQIDNITTGRFDLILKRVDEKIKLYSNKDFSEENINSFKEDIDIILNTSKMSLLSQDKESIKNKIMKLSIFTDIEKNKIVSMLSKYSKFDEDYDDLITNKIIDVKNAVFYTIDMYKKQDQAKKEINNNSISFNDMLKNGDTTIINNFDEELK